MMCDRARRFLAWNLLGASAIPALVMPSAVQAQNGSPAAPAQSGSSAESKALATGEGLDPNNILNEIIVTGARRRIESVQSVPLAVTTLNEAALERNHISNVTDMGRLAPNLIIVRQQGSSSQASIFLRGFGPNTNDPASDPPIALYVDGIYQPIAAGTQLDMFGAESVEVERGPQGTLLGKNAPTGAISITSRRPTGEWGGAGAISYERFDRKDIKSRVDIPVIAGLLAVNASLIYKEGGNYIRGSQFGNRRVFGGEKGVAARIGALFTPTDNFELLVQLNGQNSRNPETGMRDYGYLPPSGLQARSTACAVFGACTPTDRFVSGSNIKTPNREHDRQAAATATWKLAPLTITSVTGYKKLNDSAFNDCDGSVAPVCLQTGSNVYYHQFSQELRLSSAQGGGLDLGGHLDWVLGGFYSNLKFSTAFSAVIFGAPLNNNQYGRTKSHALFGHFVYNFTDKFNAMYGIRQSWDDKTHSFRAYGSTITIIDAPLSFKNLSMEGGLQYKFTPSQTVFVRYAEGYRNGGHQGQPPSGIQVPYRPETVKTYEIGLKADFLNHRLRTNLMLFQSDYKDLQRSTIAPLPRPPFSAPYTNNAASGRVRGIELETTIVPVDPLTIALTATYLQPKYKNFLAAVVPGQPPQDLSNYPFQYTSKFTVRFAPQYVADLGGSGKLTLGGNLNYATSYYTSPLPFPLGRVRPLAILNATVKWDDPSDRYYVEVYGRNLTNRYFIQQYSSTPVAPGGSTLTAAGMDARPITWGVGAGFKF
jgi:iron complex outermembrane receptor protein